MNSFLSFSRLFNILVFLLCVYVVNAQNQELTEKPAMWKDKNITTKDSGTLLYAFKNGHVNGHFRYFFMHTNNTGDLTDYYANAAGGGIKYETAKFKGFQFGVSGFFVFNIGSSNLALPDAKTNQYNRYEIGLFDITDPNNKNNIDRLEELYLKYSWGKSHITIGKQLLNTPFINLQDGRMRPTEIEGVYYEGEVAKRLKVEGGYIYAISPRSTVEFFTVAESIGVNPQGVNEYGQKSNYADNLESKGVVQVGIDYTIKSAIHLKVFNVFVENIFNTLMLQTDAETLLNKLKLISGLQLITQQSVNDGGNKDEAKTYFKKHATSLTFGVKLGIQHNQFQATVNYNRITSIGRFLMPREWGREPFFTFLPRERNEGLGNVHALAIKCSYAFCKQSVTFSTGFGIYTLPDVKNYALNKYGLPSYNQLNIDVKYQFNKLFEGLEMQLLYVHKYNRGNIYENDRYVFNKVNVDLLNVVLNYHF